MIKLNLGGGNWKKEGWTNLDKKFGYNINKKLLTSYKDNSVDLIYTSHFIEHIEPVSILKLFKDCYRVMKNGAIIRIVFPSIIKMYPLLKYKKKNELVKSCRYYKKYKNRPIDEDINELLGFSGTTKHKAILDSITVKLFLSLSGFDNTKIYDMEFNKSNAVELQKGFDSSEHILISEYVEAVK